MKRVKYLINWTQESDHSGGTERRYSALQKAFPNAVLISANEISGEKYSISKRRIAVDEFLKNNTTPEDIVIKDAGVGGICPIPARKVLLFGNPYQSMIESLGKKIDPGYWRKLVHAQIEDTQGSVLNIANSAFSKHDALLNKCRVHKVINNGVDTNFWKPDKKVEKKHVLWVGSEFKEQVSPIKVDQLMARIPISFRKIYKEHNLSNEEILQAYQEAFCLLHTFPVEGDCNVVLEALACNIPVITTDSGLFWNKYPSLAGELLPINTARRIRAIYRMISDPPDNPRGFIFREKLTEKQYIKNMQEAIKCIP